jgi:hypothetical protein
MDKAAMQQLLENIREIPVLHDFLSLSGQASISPEVYAQYDDDKMRRTCLDILTTLQVEMARQPPQDDTDMGGVSSS